MIKDSTNYGQLKIKKGATGKLLTTSDQKFSVIIFTERQEILGKGAFGKCYLGILQSSENNQTSEIQNSKNKKHPMVVVKQIKKCIQKPEQEGLYRRQIQNLSLATKIPSTSKNLVKCYPFILGSQKNYYMVMQYCQGKSLDRLMDKRMKKGEWFNFQEFLKIFSDIVSGYYPLNKLSIMHDDLKPQNIFIKGKQFKIGDFGLSFVMKGQKNITRGGSLSYNGKQKYSRNAAPSHQSDMYAIGIILFRLFYGLHPYFERSDWQIHRRYEIQRLMNLGNLKETQFKLSRWDQMEMFLKFYESRQVKSFDPLVKAPQLIQELKPYSKILIELYEQKIPKLIRKLIHKQVNDRPTFTELNIFLKENKINQILKFIQQIKSSEQAQISFFDDLNQKSPNEIKPGKSFGSLIDQICLQQPSQIEKIDVQLDQYMLKTAGNNSQIKAFLMRKFPKVFQLKQRIQDINSITRFLMRVYQELNELDLKKLSSSLRSNKNSEESLEETQCDENQILFYEDKKVQVEFVVQKYLLSFLTLVLKQVQSQIKKFTQEQLQIFYQQNVDFLLQLIEKNKEFLESQLFISYDDQLNFQNCQQQLLKIILREFLNQFTLDQGNLVLVYECVSILRIKDFISQMIKELTQSKEKQRKNQHQQPQKSEQQIFLNEWNAFSNWLRKMNSSKNIDNQQINLKSLETFVIRQLDRNKIDYMVSFD